MRPLGLALIALLLSVWEASAASIVLSPMTQPGAGPATFQVILDTGGLLAADATVELHMSPSAGVDLVSTSANTNGNPFTFGLANIRTTGCESGESFCWFGGGSNLGLSGVADPILGELILTSLGFDLDIIVSPTSRWTPFDSGFSQDVTNIGIIVGVLPEPGITTLLSIGLLGLVAVWSRLSV